LIIIALILTFSILIPTEIYRKGFQQEDCFISQVTNRTNACKEIYGCQCAKCKGIIFQCDEYPLNVPGSFLCCRDAPPCVAESCRIKIDVCLVYYYTISFQFNDKQHQFVLDKVCPIGNNNCLSNTRVECWWNENEQEFSLKPISNSTGFKVALGFTISFYVIGIIFCLVYAGCEIKLSQSQNVTEPSVGELLPLDKSKLLPLN
jgi:hypothetical protein